MIKNLFCLTLIALQSVALAEWDFAPEVHGSPYAICQSFTFSSSKLQCLNEVQGKFFYAEALQTCEGLSFDSEKLTCLRIIGNRTFSASATRVCKAMTFASGTMNCMEKIAGQRFDSDLVNACAKLSFDSEKLECMTDNANRWYDAQATQLCSSLTFSSSIQKCLSTIANRSYSGGEVGFCSSMSFDSEKISCLERTGHSYHPGLPIPNPYPTPYPPVGKACDSLLRDVTRACHLSLSAQRTLQSHLDTCEKGESKTGKTTTALFGNTRSSNLLVINLEGQERCALKSARVPGTIAYITAVRGSNRSDKIFTRLDQGQLLVMDMGHKLEEVLNANRRSYNLSRIEASAMETLRLTHRDNHQTSELTFDRMDSLAREGRLTPAGTFYPVGN